MFYAWEKREKKTPPIPPPLPCNGKIGLYQYHNFHNYMQASQIELTYTCWLQMAITWKNTGGNS